MRKAPAGPGQGEKSNADCCSPDTGSTQKRQQDHLAARPIVAIHGPLKFSYDVTDNLPSGEPWPPIAPPHELWAVVSGSTAFTTWRRITLSPAASALPPVST